MANIFEGMDQKTKERIKKLLEKDEERRLKNQRHNVETRLYIKKAKAAGIVVTAKEIDDYIAEMEKRKKGK